MIQHSASSIRAIFQFIPRYEVLYTPYHGRAIPFISIYSILFCSVVRYAFILCYAMLCYTILLKSSVFSSLLFYEDRFMFTYLMWSTVCSISRRCKDAVTKTPCSRAVKRAAIRLEKRSQKK